MNYFYLNLRLKKIKIFIDILMKHFVQYRNIIQNVLVDSYATKRDSHKSKVFASKLRHLFGFIVMIFNILQIFPISRLSKLPVFHVKIYILHILVTGD